MALLNFTLEEISRNEPPSFQLLKCNTFFKIWFKFIMAIAWYNYALSYYGLTTPQASTKSVENCRSHPETFKDTGLQHCNVLYNPGSFQFSGPRKYSFGHVYWPKKSKNNNSMGVWGL